MMAKKQKTDLEKFEEIVKWFEELIFGTEKETPKPKRARTKKGTYKADDKSTKDVNEAWVGGKAPKKKNVNK
tara:strand:- start:50 stop:265 length:216 start_codon:yes stop_codon:yes gene_type:complete